MIDQKPTFELLVMLKRLGIKFSLSGMYNLEPITVLGKFEPIEINSICVSIVTEEIKDE
jgi:hypothetical protein